MNKSTIATILGATALGLLKSSGSKNGGITIRSINELLEYANDPNKAHLVTKVFLDGNNLSSLPKEIGNLRNLKYLHLIDNNLISLPPEIGNLSHLRNLFLSHNNLASLPKEIGNLTNLKWLDLGNNNLTSLPPKMGNLSRLRDLTIDYNNLTSLPKEIGNLINLEYLYLYGNNIQIPSRNTIQYWMSNLKPNILKKIFEGIKPSTYSQLRRF